MKTVEKILSEDFGIRKVSVNNSVSWPETAYHPYPHPHPSLSLFLSQLAEAKHSFYGVITYGYSWSFQNETEIKYQVCNKKCVSKTNNSMHAISPSTNNATIIKALFAPSFLNKVK
jgi:hypothetical protein